MVVIHFTITKRWFNICSTRYHRLHWIFKFNYRNSTISSFR